MCRINHQIDFNTAVKIAESAIGDGSIGSWQKKLGEVIAMAGLRSVLSPYYEMDNLCCVSPDVAHEDYPILFELEKSDSLREISYHYQKIWQTAYDNFNRDFVVTTSYARVIIRRKENSERVIVELFIPVNVSEPIEENFKLDAARFVYVGTIKKVDHPSGVSDEDRIPDVNERSVSAPVYLIPSQNVRSIFGVTVKDDPDLIRLMARWAGWSSVKFYGGQVLLIADIAIR